MAWNQPQKIQITFFQIAYGWISHSIQQYFNKDFMFYYAQKR